MTAEETNLTVRKTLTVRCPIGHAFTTFTDGISAWWPVETHSLGQDRVETVVFEGRPAGRIYERLQDGSEREWGTVIAWEPPTRVSFDWQPNRERAGVTEVEVRFADRGGSTEVELVHRYWERLGDVAQDVRAGYDGGWDTVLGEYRACGGALRSRPTARVLAPRP